MNDAWPELTRSIVDSVHGLIRLSAEEMEIIDHPLFQRLRSIRQNGMLQFVFPAATHTRFEHSLGVLFVATSMLDAIEANSKVAAAKTKPRVIVPGKVPGKAEAGRAIDFSLLDQAAKNKLYRITRLAALVHDLGHGPLSHTFDAFAPGPEVIAKAFQDPRLEHLGPYQSGLASKVKNGKIEHEAMSCLLFALIWEKRDRETLLGVCAAILGDAVKSNVPPNLSPLVSLAHDLIASAPADADRMDYLERDSRSLGVTYGLFDRSRVLKTLLCYVEEYDLGFRYRLGLKRSGLRAIENLLQARFELFLQVYYHKTNAAASRMLKVVAEDADKARLWKESDSFTDIVNQYQGFTDEGFLSLLCGGQIGLPDPATILANQVSRRQLWKSVYECDYRYNVKTTQDDAFRAKDALSEGFSGEPFRVYFVETDATKDLEEGAGLLSRQAGGVYSFQGRGLWVKASLIVDALRKRDLAIARVYLCKDDETLASQVRDSQVTFDLRERLKHEVPPVLTKQGLEVARRSENGREWLELGRSSNGKQEIVGKMYPPTGKESPFLISVEMTLSVKEVEAFVEYGQDHLPKPDGWTGPKDV